MEIEFDPAKAKELRSRLNKNKIARAIVSDNNRYMSLYKKTMAKIPPKTFTRMNNELNRSLSSYGEKIVSGMKRAMNGTGSVDSVLKNIYDMIGVAVDTVYVRVMRTFGNTRPIHLNDVTKPEDINIVALSTTVTLIPQTISRIMCEIAIGNANYTGGMSLGVMALAMMRSVMMPIIEEWTKTYLAEHSRIEDMLTFSVIFTTCTSFMNHTLNDIMKGAVLPLSLISVIMHVFTLSLNLLTQKYAPKMKYWCFVVSSVLHISLKLSQEKEAMKPRNRKLISALNNIELELTQLYEDQGGNAAGGNNAGGNTKDGSQNPPVAPNLTGTDNKTTDPKKLSDNATNGAGEVQGKTGDKSWWDTIWGWVKQTYDWVEKMVTSTVKGAFGQNAARDENGNVIKKDGKEVTELENAKDKIVTSFGKLKNQLEKIWNVAKDKIKDQWNNAGTMTKLFFALGMFALMAAILYLLVKPDMFANAVSEFNKSISNITAGIQNAFKGGSVFGILKGLINIVLAPFKILFAALNFLIDSGIGDVIVLSLVFFTIAAGFIYYQVTKKMPWEGGESNAAPAAGGTGKYIVANDYDMANYIFGVNPL